MHRLSAVVEPRIVIVWNDSRLDIFKAALSGKSRRLMVEKMRPWNRTQVWQLALEVWDRPRARRLHHRTATIKNSRQCSSERSFVGVFQTRRQRGNLHTESALVSVAKFSTCRSAADRPCVFHCGATTLHSMTLSLRLRLIDCTLWSAI